MRTRIVYHATRDLCSVCKTPQPTAQVVPGGEVFAREHEAEFKWSYAASISRVFRWGEAAAEGFTLRMQNLRAYDRGGSYRRCQGSFRSPLELHLANRAERRSRRDRSEAWAREVSPLVLDAYEGGHAARWSAIAPRVVRIARRIRYRLNPEARVFVMCRMGNCTARATYECKSGLPTCKAHKSHCCTRIPTGIKRACLFCLAEMDGDRRRHETFCALWGLAGVKEWV